jgi:RNA polymerase sigma-70 factor (ECF subfamily)
MKEDQDAVARARRGDEAAYAELLARYRDRVFTFLLRVVGDASSAEDLAQEAFLKAFQSLDRYDPARPFLSWVFKIAHNAAYDDLRRRRVHLSLDDDNEAFELADAETSPEDAAEASFDQDLIEKAFAAMPAGYREVLILRHQEELEYAEIARITGLPEGTVKIKLFRGRDMLKGKLEALGLAPQTK